MSERGDTKRFDVTDVLPPRGAYPCRGGCGGTLELPGVCDPCGTKVARQSQNDALVEAYTSIPETLRWARIDAAELAQRVKRLPTGADERIVARAAALAGVPLVLLCGPSGSGKSSLACALLRHVIDSGRYPADASAARIGANARYASAITMVGLSAAMGASVLVFDDVGDAGESFKGSDENREIARVLSTRFELGRRTIVTTGVGREAWVRCYGDGIARRYWDAERVRVVKL